MTSALTLLCFLVSTVSEGGKGKGPSFRASSPNVQNPENSQCAGEGQFRGEMSRLARLSLASYISSFELILTVPRAEQWEEMGTSEDASLVSGSHISSYYCASARGLGKKLQVL
jgi:hypothetical protein